MNSGLILLGCAYVFSQFYRTFLAVMTDVLGTDLGITPDQLATASGLWFLAFAVMQIPVGWALDTIGPRRTSAILLLIGGAGGALVFALAQSALHINIAMMLIGVGCSPVLMAAFFVFARQYPAAMFATLGAVIIGVGSLGNLAGSAPLAWAVAAYGWRETVLVLAVITALIAAGLWITVRDPERLEVQDGGSLMTLLKMPALWLIFPLMFVSYAPAGALRGLWIGPYVTDGFAGDAGLASMMMALAMILGTFVYGPLDRLLGTRKWVIFTGNLMSLGFLVALGLGFGSAYWTAVFLFAAIGLFGMSFPIMMAHGRAFVPPALAGRGVTLMNLFGIGGVGVSQTVSGQLFSAQLDSGATSGDAYHAVFLFFAALLAIGLMIYAFSRDRLD